MLSKLLSTAKRLGQKLLSRWKLLLLIIVIIAGGGYWYYQRQTTNGEELTFIHPERGNLTKTIEVSGVITAKEYAQMRFAAGGKVVYLGAKEGDWVKKGQTIATIDARDLKKNLEKTLNLYSQERLDWDQTLDDTKDRWLPADEVRDKQSEQYDLSNTVLDVELRSIAISNTVLSAPFAGVLVASPTHVTGVNLLATDVFELVNPETVYFQAQVDELDIREIRETLPATIELDAYPDMTFASNVKFISYKAAQTTTSTVFLVEFPLPQTDLEKFRLGMNGDAIIQIETKENILSVPIDTTIDRDGKTFIQVKVSEEETEEREIETGMETDDRIEVLSGLSEDDEIVLPE